MEGKRQAGNIWKGEIGRKGGGERKEKTRKKDRKEKGEKEGEEEKE